MHREEQLEHYLQQVIAEFFLKNIEFPLETLVTVTKVELTKDRRHGTVWISVLPDEKGSVCTSIIRKNLYFIQGEVNRKVQTRPVPRLSIKIDAGPAYSEHIEELLKKIDE
jgi:ribosome-binding factor A